MPEPLAPVAPPSVALQDRFNQAAASGDPAAVRAIAPVAAGTTLQADAEKSAAMMERNAKPILDITNTANAKGGIENRDARIAVAEQIKNEYKSFQPETGFLKFLGASLMGVPDAWKMATPGRQESTVEYDKFGRGAIAIYNQNNPKSPAFVVDSETKLPISLNEYTERGFNLYKDAASSPFLQASGEVYKNRLNAFESSASKANVSSAVYSEVGKNTATINQKLENLSSGPYNLTNKQLNEIHSLTSKVMNVERSISDSMNILTQAQDTDSRKKALEQLQGISGGLGLGDLGVNAKGQIVDSKNRNVSITDMSQRVTDYLKKNGLSTQYTQARDELIRSKVFQNLPDAKLKGDLIDVMNLLESNHRLMNDMKLSGNELPFLTSSIPMKFGDPFRVGIVSNLYDQYKSEAALAYAEFFQKQSQFFSKDKPPVAGTIENAFARSPILAEIRAKYETLIKNAENRVYPEPKDTESAIGGTISGTPVENPQAKDDKPKLKDRNLVKPPEKVNHSKNILDILNKNKRGQ